jgi:hypothetical protein
LAYLRAGDGSEGWEQGQTSTTHIEPDGRLRLHQQEDINDSIWLAGHSKIGRNEFFFFDEQHFVHILIRAGAEVQARDDLVFFSGL